MKRVCVFCGSSPGASEEYLGAAALLGQALVKRGQTLVYGGASVGAMGMVARTVLASEGKVIGVIPQGLMAKGVAFTELPDLRVVDTMHQRKALMIELSDAFIALPGGLGTVEEFFEALSWGQLRLHGKPCGLLNVEGYYDKLLEFLDHAVEQRFMELAHREMILVEDHPERLLEKFEEYQPPRADKAAWIMQMNKGAGEI